MKVTAYTTNIIRLGDSLEELLSRHIKQLPEKSIVAIVSKAFSFAQRRLVKKITGSTEEKHELAKQEADYYLDASVSKYNLLFTIKGSWMFVNAGIDESNSEDSYTLWPKDPQESVNAVWHFLRSHYGVKQVGVIMTDSKSMPLNWGVVGHGIAHCGFQALKDYRGTKDLFGREMQMEQLNIVQSVAAAACLEMGEGSEQRPLAVISEIQQDVIWQDHVPTEQELAGLSIGIADDAYAPLLTGVEWKKGGGKIS